MILRQLETSPYEPPPEKTLKDALARAVPQDASIAATSAVPSVASGSGGQVGTELTGGVPGCPRCGGGRSMGYDVSDAKVDVAL